MANDNITGRAPVVPTSDETPLEARILEASQAAGDCPINRREEFLRDQTQCCLCGEALTFTHKIELSEEPIPKMLMREEAHCPTCRIPLRRERHAIQ
jgi:hypothetical protein